MSKKHTVTFTSTILLWPGSQGAWHFLPMPKKETLALKAEYGHLMRGFGSFPVTATIHDISWQTSIFYDSHSSSYLLPLKAKIRRETNLSEGDRVSCTLTLRI